MSKWSDRSSVVPVVDREGVCSKLARAFRGSTKNENARQMIREGSEPPAFFESGCLFESTAKQPLSKFNAS